MPAVTGHDMPFGAALVEAAVRFRLWAPAARSVELILGDASDDGAALTMQRRAGDDGWFQLVTDRARAGTRYRYRIDGGQAVPDPASRHQPQGVHGPSEVIDPGRHAWRQNDWRGRPWAEAVVYELHVGAFTAEGTFEAVGGRLDHLADLGVTAIELMPIAAFPGARNWGYDGVLPFAPDASYGRPEALKALVDAAHARGLMVLLDVVYNHFGPDGNYLGLYAPQFFTDAVATPWGQAIDFARREVRDFFIHNALFWLEEYRFDGLRLDAVHAIADRSEPHILDALAEAVRTRINGERIVHLILENENNESHRLERRRDGTPARYTAQWNDDIHHAAHVLATGEDAAYYEDFADAPCARLARALAEGFAYQGEPSRHNGGRPRGEPSRHLPPAAFVGFLQNHDHIGNRALGERLSALARAEVVAALRAIILLAPAPPMLFMGEEWQAPEPFLFFCDFHDALAVAVRDGRRREFARFPAFADPAARSKIPDPNAPQTFLASKLDWTRLGQAPHDGWLAGCRALLHLRQREIVPRLPGMKGGEATALCFGEGGLFVRWRLGDGARLAVVANLADREESVPDRPEGRVIHTTAGTADPPTASGRLAPWSVTWLLDP